MRDELYRALTGGRSPRTEGLSVAAMVGEVERFAGSGRAAARLAGVPESTWRGLRAGRVASPKEPTVNALRRAQRRVRLSRGREARIRNGAPFGVRGTVVVSSDVRPERPLVISGWKAWDAMAAGSMLDKWLQGDDAGAEQVIRDAIAQEVPGMRVEQTDEVRVFATDAAADVWRQS